ncbi:DUF4148 domain-containing protein [Paraburkholderia aspalathi]|jgi:hypothetical protein|uniref:DUF4148 domain-containing protein n=1 Tax=Paraburkholderia aspalathi TaxID=1324617 RepID=A0A1I7DBK1_9BURK|nr:DUF4148 domain-containing protein [Paraburkholderia aspalathi]SFU09098.1 protein of unknown function [Paraburkholderia aspalathi]
MNATIQAAAVILTLLAIPVVSSAQTASSLTRAEVKSRLIQIEQAGYNPATADPYAYPDNVQAAEARVTARQGAINSNGGSVPCSSQSARPVLREE